MRYYKESQMTAVIFLSLEYLILCVSRLVGRTAFAGDVRIY